MAEDEKKEVSFSDKISSFLGSASKTVNSVFDTAAEKANEIGKDVKGVVEEKMKEREASEIYRKLGKKVYTLVLRNEITLPESCDKYIDALKDLYPEEDRDESVEQPACECKDAECKCDDDGKDA